jgi:hypothetical protein
MDADAAQRLRAVLGAYAEATGSQLAATLSREHDLARRFRRVLAAS